MSQTFMGRLTKEADLLAALTTVCKENNIRRGSVQVIGALEKAVLGYYHQDRREYEHHPVTENVEILSGLGNISIKDGEPFVHMHLTLSKADCSCVGGHAMPGCTIFAAEAVITEIPGPDLVRGPDAPTGLPLWMG